MREQLRWEHAAESASPQADPTSVMHERLTAKPLLHATFIAPVRANAVDEANSVNVGATLLWKLSGTPCTVAEFSLYTLVALGSISEPDSSSSYPVLLVRLDAPQLRLLE
jgi:hypothetical protein